MSKLAEYLYGDVEYIEYPHDIEQLKEAIPQLRTIPNSLIQKMYKDYSNDMCAGWMIVDDGEIEHFKRWLL